MALYSKQGHEVIGTELTQSVSKHGPHSRMISPLVVGRQIGLTPLRKISQALGMGWNTRSVREAEMKGRKEIGEPLGDVHPNAAGLDIGAREIWACVPADRDAERVRGFGTFTPDLYQLAEWLTQCGVDTVAMESTGVYWIPVFEILEARGFEVYLVNARHLKNVPGRKSDYQDCQWIQKLHRLGLLASSFRPDAEMCRLRGYLRHRAQLGPRISCICKRPFNR
jgi:hypothetical protein